MIVYICTALCKPTGKVAYKALGATPELAAGAMLDELRSIFDELHEDLRGTMDDEDLYHAVFDPASVHETFCDWVDDLFLIEVCEDATTFATYH